MLPPSSGQGRRLLPTQKNLRTRFYEDYYKMAVDHDKDLVKKYDDDLDTTLIFVRYHTARVSYTC